MRSAVGALPRSAARCGIPNGGVGGVSGAGPGPAALSPGGETRTKPREGSAEPSRSPEAAGVGAAGGLGGPGDGQGAQGMVGDSGDTSGLWGPYEAGAALPRFGGA